MDYVLDDKCFTVVDVTDAVQIALAIFIEQVLSSCSNYFHRVV